MNLEKKGAFAAATIFRAGSPRCCNGWADKGRGSRKLKKQRNGISKQTIATNDAGWRNQYPRDDRAMGCSGRRVGEKQDSKRVPFFPVFGSAE